MNILIIGGDNRTLKIIEYFRAAKNNVDVVGFDSIGLDTLEASTANFNSYDAVIFPIDGIKSDYSITAKFNSKILNIKDFKDLKDIKIFKNVKGSNYSLNKKTIIFTGIQTEKMDEIFANNYIKLMNYDDVATENSIPTCEGILADIIQNTDQTIHYSNIAVLGYGRIGLTLVDMLIKLGANVEVGVNKESTYSILINNHMHPFYTTNMNEVLSNFNVIINTVPHLLLDKSALDLIKSDTYILDISSYPYGVDFNYANSKHIKCNLLKGIPGKVAPKTAGDILARKIDLILKEDL